MLKNLIKRLTPLTETFWPGLMLPSTESLLIQQLINWPDVYYLLSLSYSLFFHLLTRGFTPLVPIPSKPVILSFIRGIQFRIPLSSNQSQLSFFSANLNYPNQNRLAIIFKQIVLSFPNNGTANLVSIFKSGKSCSCTDVACSSLTSKRKLMYNLWSLTFLWFKIIKPPQFLLRIFELIANTRHLYYSSIA